MASRSVTTAVQTRFADLDPLGHVNNVAFFTYMETARIRFIDQVRGSIGRVLVARSECDHRAEIGAHVRTVDVTVSAESVGRTSIVLLHELTVEGRPVATGRVVLVKVDADHRPVPVSDAERALLLSS
ncbi:MAG: Thioesterase superfamily [Frankiales bacterium]|nr:Thioesterase superfamily [Frankiales bacterium]